MSQSVTFFVDYDNTISNNDQVKISIENILAKKFNKKFALRFSEIAADIRKKTGHDSIAKTFRKLAIEFKIPTIDKDFHKYFHGIKFQNYLFDKTPHVLKWLQHFGITVVFTEGNKHYQLLKIKKSGVFKMVSGNVEIFPSDKPSNLKHLFVKYPSRIYYLIEDKPLTLTKVKELYGDKIQTIHVCQDHYSTFCDRKNFDLKVNSIEALLDINFPLQKKIT